MIYFSPLHQRSAIYLIPTRRVTAIKLRKKLPLLRASSQAPAWEFSTGSSGFPARKARALLTGFPSGSLGTSVSLNLMAVTRRVGRATPCNETVATGYYPLLNGVQNVGRNKPTRRQQGWVFPALRCVGVPETPILRLRHGQAYSGLLRDVNNDERSAWQRGRA
jgi:hypothetical protein